MTNRIVDVGSSRGGGGGGGAGAVATDSAEDWESMLDSGQLDKSLEQLAVSRNANSCHSQLPQAAAASDSNKYPAMDSSSSNNVTRQMMLDDPFFCGPVRILTHDGNAARTQYRPPEPQLKILKRPPSESGPVKAAENQQGVSIKTGTGSGSAFFLDSGFDLHIRYADLHTL